MNGNPASADKARRERKLVIGLLGGIGAGKSRVASLLAERGGRVIAADELGHEALRQPEILREVVQRWGEKVLDEKGAVDRRKLGAAVFADPAARMALEAMVHPWIGQRARQEIRLAQAVSGVGFVVLDAAVMLEAGWHDVCDRLLFVHVPDEVRLQRLQEQRHWTAHDLAVRERAQMDLAEKARRADAIVDNSGSIEQTAEQLDRALERWGIDAKRQVRTE